MKTIFIPIWIGIGAVLGVAAFLLLAWEEAVRIHNKTNP